METKKSPDCLLCTYQHAQKLQGPDGTLQIGVEVAICRRFPPSAVFVSDGRVGQIIAQFPPVVPGMFCSLFEPKDADPDAYVAADDVQKMLTG